MLRGSLTIYLRQIYTKLVTLGNIRSRDALRPIARKQKDLIDFKT